MYATGFVALGAAPVTWFRVVPQISWYPVEVGVSFALAVLYLLRKWPVPALITVLMVCAHYGFWYVRFWWASSGIVRPFVVPFLGLCACLVWMKYVAMRRHGRTGPA